MAHSGRMIWKPRAYGVPGVGRATSKVGKSLVRAVLSAIITKYW